MDLPNLNALLRVNGLTKDSSPENIRDVLLRSGYTPDEVPAAIRILQGGAPPPPLGVPQAYVEGILERTRVVPAEDEGSIFTGRIGVRQFWLGTGLALVSYALVFIEASAIPIFSLISGISLFSPPDLATAPVRSLLVFGIGVAMLVLPGIFLLAVSIGLQLRRCHDYGLSGAAWFMALLALLVGGYLLARLTPLAEGAAVGAFVLWLGFMSWPGSHSENLYGSAARYPSLWGALYGSYAEEGCLNVFVRRFLLPVVYLQALGLFLCLCIHTLAPRAHLPGALR